MGPNATFTNDPFPRSRQHLAEYVKTIVHRGASIGANATVPPGITIAKRALVGAGAVVTRSVPANTIVTDNPAHIRGYVDSLFDEPPVRAATAAAESVRQTSVRGVIFHRLHGAKDLHSSLAFAEAGRHLLFEVRRFLLVYGMPSQEVRGEHAHRELHQFLLYVQGSCHLIADDGENREAFRLDMPSVGVHLPPVTWGMQFKHSPGTVLLVLASTPYNAELLSNANGTITRRM